jgi:hypothetical protein
VAVYEAAATATGQREAQGTVLVPHLTRAVPIRREDIASSETVQAVTFTTRPVA